MKLAEYLPPQPTLLWKLSVQMGLSHAVSKLPDPLGEEWKLPHLLEMKQRFADAGLDWQVLEPAPPKLHQPIKLGLPNRDEAIDQTCQLVQNLGEVGVGVLCYNFMAGLGWTRTNTAQPTRGGALVSRYDHAEMQKQPLTEWGEVSEQQLWENLHYFLERVVPVAESAGVKLALHPDDPPLSPIRGIGRILTSPEAIQKAINLVPSPNSGITFCQGTFKTMGADIPETIRGFGQKIFFVHFRDTRGTPESFEETFHDDGPTDMYAAMKAYKEVGFLGLMRPDHVPTMEGESNENPGYETMGRLFAVGYLKGLMEAVEKESPKKERV